MRTITLDTHISHLEIGNEFETARVVSILKSVGITTVRQLCKQTKSDLQKIAKIGDITIIRIEFALYKYGLTLGMNDEAFIKIDNEGGLCHKDDVIRCLNYQVNKYKDMLDDEDVEDDYDEDEDELYYEEDLDEGDYDEDDGSNHSISIDLNVTNAKQPFDLDERLWEVAKEEFLRSSPEMPVEERSQHALKTATNFVADFVWYTQHLRH